MFCVGDKVINKNELRVKNHQLTGDKYVLTKDIYEIYDLNSDGFGQIKMMNINDGKTCYCSNKDCLIKVF